MAVAAESVEEVAEQAEQAKCLRYSAMESKFFVPIAIESSEIFGSKAYTFLNDLSRRLMSVTMNSHACHHLLQ